MSKFEKYDYSFEDLKNRVNNILNKELKELNKIEALRTILNVIDLTTLNGDDTSQRVIDLCNKGISYKDEKLDIPEVAAVCVYPVFVPMVKKALKESDIKTAAVAGAFPSGQSPLEIRIAEAKWTAEKGADDIDMVISRGRLIEKDYDFIVEEVNAIKKSIGSSHLKVILETGELKTVDNIRRACELAIEGGADFLKTSTGKISPAATPEAFLIMIDTIKEFFALTGKKIGIKPAGGISTVKDSLNYYMLVKNILGEEWLNNKLFRIGASRLADNVYNELIKLNTF
jgi:deoxyribose-phosphate aldolase